MKKLISAVLAVVVGAGMVYGKATTGVAIFNHSVGARQLGMADVAVGIADDANAIFYNPAGLTQINKLELNAMYFDNIIDTKDESLSMAYPLRKSLFGRKASLGLGIRAYQGGTLEYIKLDPTGTQIIEQKTLSAENDYMGIVGYAEEVADGVSVGLALKGIRSTLVEDYTASAVAFDVGVLYRLPMMEGLSIGVSILNTGTEMKFIEEGDALPQRTVVGLGYEMRPIKSIGLKVGGDYINEREGDGMINVGFEVGLHDMVMLRGGYLTDSDLGSITMGIGIRLGWIQLDYGYSMMDELGNLQKASLTFRWDTVRKEEVSKKASKEKVVKKKSLSKKKKILIRKKIIRKKKSARRYNINE